MNDLPAILRGKPAFAQLLPIVRPTLPPWRQQVAAEVEQLFQTGVLTKGHNLRAMEESLARYLGVRHAVGVASCTVGLLLTYQALKLSGEVIVPSFTFMATVHPLILLGIEPVFVDIDPATWNIDTVAVERAITPRTSAIIAVHIFGNPAAVEELEAIARARKLRLVFDSAHGFGASHRGRPVGGSGDAEVFSMSPTKLLVAGEGGVVATNSDELADYVRVGREYGNRGSYDSEFAGINGRLPEFNAALALMGLATLDDNSRARGRLVARFKEQLGETPGIRTQAVHHADRCSYKDLCITVDEQDFGLSRDELAAALRADNVDTRNYYDPPVHRQTAYRHLLQQYDKTLPVTDSVASRALSLPLWSHMPGDTMDNICGALVRIQRHASEVRKALRSPSQDLSKRT